MDDFPRTPEQYVERVWARGLSVDDPRRRTMLDLKRAELRLAANLPTVEELWRRHSARRSSS